MEAPRGTDSFPSSIARIDDSSSNADDTYAVFCATRAPSNISVLSSATLAMSMCTEDTMDAFARDHVYSMDISNPSRVSSNVLTDRTRDLSTFQDLNIIDAMDTAIAEHKFSVKKYEDLINLIQEVRQTLPPRIRERYHEAIENSPRVKELVNKKSELEATNQALNEQLKLKFQMYQEIQEENADMDRTIQELQDKKAKQNETNTGRSIPVRVHGKRQALKACMESLPSAVWAKSRNASSG